MATSRSEALFKNSSLSTSSVSGLTRRWGCVASRRLLVFFFVFLDEGLRQSYLASRHRRQVTVPTTYHRTSLFERHTELLQSLIRFVAARGRLPEATEFEEAE